MVVFKVIRVESWSKLLLFMLFILVLIGIVSAVSATDSVTDIAVSDASVGAIALESQDLNKTSDDLNIQMFSLNNNNLNDEDSILINSEDIVNPNELNENIIVSNLNAVQNDITNVGLFDVQAYLAINSSKIVLGDTIKLTPTIKEILGNNIVKTGEVVYCLSNGVRIGNSSADGYLEYTPTATGTYGFYAYFVPDNLHIYNLWEFDVTNHVYLVVSSYIDSEVNDSDVPDDQNETDINGTVLDDNQTVDINSTVIDDNQSAVINGDIVDKNNNSNKSIVINDDVILPNGSSQKINVKIMIANSTAFGETINFIIEINDNSSNDSTSVVVNESLSANNENIGYPNGEYDNPTVTVVIVFATGILVAVWLFVFIVII